MCDSKPKGFEPKMRWHKLRSGVNLQGASKQKDVKKSVEQGLDTTNL